MVMEARNLRAVTEEASVVVVCLKTPVSMRASHGQSMRDEGKKYKGEVNKQTNIYKATFSIITPFLRLIHPFRCSLFGPITPPLSKCPKPNNILVVW